MTETEKNIVIQLLEGAGVEFALCRKRGGWRVSFSDADCDLVREAGAVLSGENLCVCDGCDSLTREDACAEAGGGAFCPDCLL